MGWYMAVIVRGSFTGLGYDRNLMGDLLYKLIEAPDAEAAYDKAIALAEKAVDTYNDDDGTEISLRAMGLADLMEIVTGKPEDGSEVYSQAVNSSPKDRVVEKEALTAFRPWEILEEEGSDLGEEAEPEELGEIEEPGADRFRPPQG